MLTTDPLERLRRLCIALRETTERLSHGEPTWFVRGKKVFVMFANNHHDDGRIAFWCASPSGANETMVGADAVRFFRPRSGWPGVRVDGEVDGTKSARSSTTRGRSLPRHAEQPGRMRPSWRP